MRKLLRAAECELLERYTFRSKAEAEAVFSSSKAATTRTDFTAHWGMFRGSLREGRIILQATLDLPSSQPFTESGQLQGRCSMGADESWLRMMVNWIGATVDLVQVGALALNGLAASASKVTRTSRSEYLSRPTRLDTLIHLHPSSCTYFSWVVSR